MLNLLVAIIVAAKPSRIWTSGKFIFRKTPSFRWDILDENATKEHNHIVIIEEE
jgi:hypothetical protein